MRFCGNCGGSIQEDQKYCPYCGLRIDLSSQSDGIRNGANIETPIKQERIKRIRIWATVYLIASVMNYLAWMAFSAYLPFGPLSCLYAFILAAFSELHSIWGYIETGYYFFIILFSVFVYVITFVKGKGLWFLVLCCIDIAMCLVLFLFVPDVYIEAEQWVGLGVQIFHALLFFIINYVWKRERIRSFAYKAV